MTTDRTDDQIEALSDGMLVFELTGDPSYLTDNEILAELLAE